MIERKHLKKIEAQPGQGRLPRCGKCEAYKTVSAAQRLLMPSPPEHANDLMVNTWNKTLCDNPCEEWGK